MTHRLLTPADVANACQVSEKTVYRAIRRGDLQATLLGTRGAYRIKPEWLEDWLDRRVQARSKLNVASQRADRLRQARSERGRLTLMPEGGPE